MRRKIQRSMCLVAFLALLISGILTVAAVYQQTVMNKTAELRQEAEYIQAAVDIAGEEYLNVMDNVQKSTRLTLVGQDGTVLYDSVQDDTTLENHKNRKEIKGAMENGRGEAVRTSDTLGQKDVLLCDPTAGWDGLRAPRLLIMCFQQFGSFFHTSLGSFF